MLKDGLGPSVAHIYASHGQPDCMQEVLLAGAYPNAFVDGLAGLLRNEGGERAPQFFCSFSLRSLHGLLNKCR